ncbi:MAG: phage major capsid protein, partial [Proteobacteria bacterium]|nr:phage major capsid protein [Pseudomonadota bacterium]
MLTAKQKADLRKLLAPLIQDALKDGLAPAIRSEIGRMSDEDRNPSYTQRILNGRAGHGRGRQQDMSEAARVFARLGLCALMGGGDHARELEVSRTLDIESHYKAAQSAGSAEGGGLLILDDMANEVIELLSPFSVVRQIGARSVSIPRGSLRTPKITSGVSSGYVGEGQAIPSSQMKTGQISLQARKLASLVVLTSELGAFAVDIDAILLDDMLSSIGKTEDIAFLFGSGTENEPRGIADWAIDANVFNATQAGGTATLTEVQTDLRKAEDLLLSADVPMRTPVWIMSPRSRLFLRDLRDTQDKGIFGDEMRQSRTINGVPFFQTNNIPNNLGGGSNESVVILVDASEVIIGDVPQVSVDRTNAATVKIN